jgi:hypothetical protein
MSRLHTSTSNERKVRIAVRIRPVVYKKTATHSNKIYAFCNKAHVPIDTVTKMSISSVKYALAMVLLATLLGATARTNNV